MWRAYALEFGHAWANTVYCAGEFAGHFPAGESFLVFDEELEDFPLSDCKLSGLVQCTVGISTGGPGHMFLW